MCRERATPTPLDTDGLFFLNQSMTVWGDIRNVLSIVEELRKQQPHRNARVEVYHHSENKVSLKVPFRTVQELDDYLNSRLRRMLLEGVGDSLRINDLERASSEINERFNEMNAILGHVVLEN